MNYGGNPAAAVASGGPRQQEAAVIHNKFDIKPKRKNLQVDTLPICRRYALHLVPSGILNQNAMCVIGNGVVVHLPGLFEEIEKLQAKGIAVDGSRMLLSDRAHLLFDLHKEIDGAREAELAGKMIGTTKRGIGAYGSSISCIFNITIIV